MLSNPPPQSAHPCGGGCSDCDGALCPMSTELTAQCTDQCVVVACTDPNHSALRCGGQGTQAHCDLVCDSATNCVDCNGFDAFLQCCTDYHSYFSDPQWNRQSSSAPSAQNQDWGWCDCPHTDQSAVAPVASPEPPMQVNLPFVQPQSQSQAPSAPMPKLTEKCMWSNCGASFATLSDLVGHVNLVHLRPSQSPEAQVDSVTAQAANTHSSLACLWDDCSVYLAPENIAGPSHSSEATDIRSLLESHLLQHHLGLHQADFSTPRPLPEYLLADAVPSPQPASTPTPRPPSTAPSQDSGSSSSSSPSDVHTCHWRGCDACFPSCDDLTAHLTAVHVGSGKAHYECFWEGCNRNGDEGFSSKQKICRHLQSHTGHRPFQCQLCHQNFSEAATLQQHMRRHTQEKPYLCDFPGCGKSFAIMGALTIHKRTHNGQKPFRCSYCDKAFSESSNLSKHLRTHTGLRPYTCTEPGCGKSFARPDQLTRHAGVHRKKMTPQV